MTNLDQHRRKSAEEGRNTMSRRKQVGLRQLERQVLPEGFDATEEVAKANRAAVEAIEEARRAVGAAHTARHEADRAPEADAAAELEAYQAGKSLPKAKAPALEAKAEQAERVSRLAQQNAAHAVDVLHVAINNDRDALIARQEAKVNEAHDRAAAQLDGAKESLVALRREAGRLSGLHERKRELDHHASRRSGEFAAVALADARQALTTMRDSATPWTTRVLEAIGEGSTWEAACDKLGVGKLDDRACAARNFLIDQRRLEQLDAEGEPLRGHDPLVPRLARAVTLVPSTPPERRIDRIRRERREQQERAA